MRAEGLAKYLKNPLDSPRRLDAFPQRLAARSRRLGPILQQGGSMDKDLRHVVQTTAEMRMRFSTEPRNLQPWPGLRGTKGNRKEVRQTLT